MAAKFLPQWSRPVLAAATTVLGCLSSLALGQPEPCPCPTACDCVETDVPGEFCETLTLPGHCIVGFCVDDPEGRLECGESEHLKRFVQSVFNGGSVGGCFPYNCTTQPPPAEAIYDVMFAYYEGCDIEKSCDSAEAFFYDVLDEVILCRDTYVGAWPQPVFDMWAWCQRAGQTDPETACDECIAARPPSPSIPFPVPGTNVNGSPRRNPILVNLAKDPNNDGWTSSAGSYGGVDLAEGVIDYVVTDLALPSAGFSWQIGRSYGPRNFDGTDYGYRDDVQGRNWFQTSMPFIWTEVYDPFVGRGTDRVYFMDRADTHSVFARADSDTFKGSGGSGGLMQDNGVVPNTYTMYDQTGLRMVFFAENISAGLPTLHAVANRLWKIIDPAGNVAYVGHPTDPEEAVDDGYDDYGNMLLAFDTNGRRYTYSYTTVESELRLTQVLAEQYVVSTWTEVGRVGYAYYSEADAHGSKGDLKLVTVTMPQSDSTPSVRTTYYRYYDDTWSNSDGRRGHAHFFKYVVDAEGYRRADWENGTPASTLDGSTQALSDADLRPYASAFYEYTADGVSTFADRRIAKMWSNGDCGCGTAPNGLTTLTYDKNVSFVPGSPYASMAWSSRTIVQQPDDVWLTQYFDGAGQPNSRILTLGDPTNPPGIATTWTTDFWATTIIRDGAAQNSAMYSPAAATVYDHTGAAITVDASAGLATIYQRFDNTASPATKRGMIQHVRWRVGSNPANPTYFGESRDYELATMTVSGQTIDRSFISNSWVYPTETTTAFSGAEEFEITPAFWTGDAALMPKSITTTNPIVSVANNGDGTVATGSVVYLREDGTVGFSQNEQGILNYSQYVGGLLVKSIEDVNPNTSGDFGGGDGPGHWGMSTPDITAAYRLITTYTHRRDGRIESVTLPNGRILWDHYTTLGDGRNATVSVPRVNSATSPSTWYGPASYSVRNDHGAVEFTAVIDLAAASTGTGISSWITEATSDPIAAVTGPSGVVVTHVSTILHNGTGSRALGSRRYFTVPSTLPGSNGTHYDEATFVYDGMGRKVITTGATGTITRTNYDVIGRYSSREIGTVASGGGANMERIEVVEYDGGLNRANGYITRRTRFADAAESDARVTDFVNDARGRTIIVKPELGPFSVAAYDNQGRVIASATYSDVTGFDATTDPRTEDETRLSLSEAFFDEMQRGFRTRRWEIDQTDGAKISGSAYLDSDTWFDAAGRVIKIVSSQVSKTAYDRIGRPTNQFIIASTLDTDYDHADDVSGDVVIEEHQTYYNSIGLPLMRVNLSRFHDDYGGGSTTGALDTDSDLSLIDQSELDGRPQIVTLWYDGLDRLTTTAAYGTYGTSDFDRDTTIGSEPTASDSSTIVAIRAYRTDGWVGSQKDGLGRVTTTSYDSAGRPIATVENDVSSPSQNDQDRITRYEYADGLQTVMYVDLDRDAVRDVTDQCTFYTYGVPKGSGAGDSQIASNSLLWKAQYPDSSGGTDVAIYAYNVLGQQTWTKDQSGNILETNYDEIGRIAHRRATTVATGVGVDATVRRITLSYDDRGRSATISQWDNPASGSGNELDRVSYGYDDWGALASLEQDLDGYDGGTPTDYRYTVGYSYERVNPASEAGRRTYRRIGLSYPSGFDHGYSYSSISGRLDDALSRVTNLMFLDTDPGTPFVEYEYVGVGAVVEKDLLLPAVTSRVFSSGHDYDRLDRWDRIIRSNWERRTAGPTFVPFYDLTIAYDTASNITGLDDGYIESGFDVKVTSDALNRVTRYEEGTLSAGMATFSSRIREQQLDFDLLANWTRNRRWIESNGAWGYSGGETTDDTRTFNAVNEIATNDFGNDASSETAPSYDPNGNQVRDGGTAGASVYAFVYDAFNRLVEVKTTDGTPVVVGQYRYNGLGQRVSFRHEENGTGTISNDPWFNVVYDERWRMIAVYHQDDDDPTDAPKEQFVYHAAGANGSGNASYIDDTVLRDRDHNSAWISASDGTLERRDYYCQNWRADVVALVDTGAVVVEHVRYGLSGEPFAVSSADVTYSATGGSNGLGIPNGLVNNDDYFHYLNMYSTPIADPRTDFDHNGTLNGNDYFAFIAKHADDVAKTWGPGVLSNAGNRKGYAGYERDRAIGKLCHVRMRVHDSSTGRWLRRDPLGYFDGLNLSAMLAGRALGFNDALGLAGRPVMGGGCSGGCYPIEGDDPPFKPDLEWLLVPDGGDTDEHLGAVWADNAISCVEDCQECWSALMSSATASPLALNCFLIFATLPNPAGMLPCLFLFLYSIYEGGQAINSCVACQTCLEQSAELAQIRSGRGQNASISPPSGADIGEGWWPTDMISDGNWWERGISERQFHCRVAAIVEACTRTEMARHSYNEAKSQCHADAVGRLRQLGQNPPDDIESQFDITDDLYVGCMNTAWRKFQLANQGTSRYLYRAWYSCVGETAPPYSPFSQ